MIVTDYATECTLYEVNRHIFTVKFSFRSRDYVIFGLNNDNNYNESLKLKTNTEELLQEFKRFISIWIVIWKEVLANTHGGNFTSTPYEAHL